MFRHDRLKTAIALAMLCWYGFVFSFAHVFHNHHSPNDTCGSCYDPCTCSADGGAGSDCHGARMAEGTGADEHRAGERFVRHFGSPSGEHVPCPACQFLASIKGGLVLDATEYPSLVAADTRPFEFTSIIGFSSFYTVANFRAPPQIAV